MAETLIAGVCRRRFREFGAQLLRRFAHTLTTAADAIHRLPAAPVSPALEPSKKELAHAEWLAVSGDKTLRLDYPLDRHAVVFDVGGFEGQWASDIFSRYVCRIHVFEPVPKFAEGIAKRFVGNDRIKVHCTAIGPSAGEMTIFVQGDRSSVHARAEERIRVSVTTLEAILASEVIEEVDLIKINIEGAEYELLDHLIDTGLIKRFVRLQIQFHDFIADAEIRMRSIQRRLEDTHRLTYQFPFIWENWERRDGR